MTNLIDLEITGASKMPGGEYRDVDISGAGKIEGDLRCKSLDISGSGKVNGGVVCEGSVDCSGASKIYGGLEAEHLNASGAFEVEGYCEIHGDVDTSGAAKFQSALRANSIDVSGSFSCAGDVTAEQFSGDGLCKIEGLLNAETVELRLVGNSSISDIGGSEITVKSERRWHLFRSDFCTLSCNSIEGDRIDLECTEAEIVRGKTVSIGPGCRVRRVEFAEKLTTAADAIIGEKIQIS